MGFPLGLTLSDKEVQGGKVGVEAVAETTPEAEHGGDVSAQVGTREETKGSTESSTAAIPTLLPAESVESRECRGQASNQEQAVAT